MQRGRYCYGPGFWKRDIDWVPGDGGFRGGPYSQGRGPYPTPWWNRCQRFTAGYASYPSRTPEQQSQDEVVILKEQAETLRAELEVIENKLSGLEQERNND